MNAMRGIILSGSSMNPDICLVKCFTLKFVLFLFIYICACFLVVLAKVLSSIDTIEYLSFFLSIDGTDLRIFAKLCRLEN